MDLQVDTSVRRNEVAKPSGLSAGVHAVDQVEAKALDDASLYVSGGVGSVSASVGL